MLLLLLSASVAGCDQPASGSDSAESDTLTIFAASSLTDAFAAVATAFEAREPEVDVVLNTAGSSQLAAQLRNGTPADLFASANPAQMQTVVDAGRIAPGSASIFAANALVIVLPSDNPAGITTFADLARPGVALVLATTGVPIRSYTDALAEGLDSAERAQFYANAVTEEPNVRQVLAKVALGEADAAIVYASDLMSGSGERVRSLPLPTTDAPSVIDQPPVVYPIAPLMDTANPELARRFVAFLLSADGQAILQRWGFAPPPDMR